MNILYIGFYELPDKDAAANRVINNGKIFRDIGYNVSFIDEKRYGVNLNVLLNKCIIDEMTVWSTLRPNTFINYLKKMTSITNIKKVVRQYDKIDLIIAYNYPSIALLRLKLFCNMNNIKLISDCTEWYSGNEYNFPKNLLSAMDSTFRMRIVNKMLDGIICISDYLKNYYKECNTIKIPPLIDASDKIWNQKNFDWDVNKLNLIYAGNPGKNKENILPIIQSIHKSINKSSIVFRIVGITKSQFLELYPDKVKLINDLKDSLIFYGRISHTETAKMISSSDYMVFIREKNRVTMAGFSTKFVEAVTCGTAVITTDTSDLKNIINKNKCGNIVNNEKELNDFLNSDFEILKIKAKFENRFLFDYKNYMIDLHDWINDLI